MAHAKHEPNRPGSPSKPAHLEGNELDIYPAGAADSHGHHGHVIVPPSTLIAVLVALLALTVLTVATAQLEGLLITTFNIVIPQWLNVAVALGIAAVKTTLVVIFFMQLKYDNPINTLVFVFTLATVSLFIGLTMIDLGNRDTVYRYKAEQVVTGGTGIGGTGIPITAAAATAAENPEHPLHHLWLKAHGGHGGHGDPDAAPVATPGPVAPRAMGFPTSEDAFTGSSPWQSRPVTGLTLPGFAPAHDDHAPDNHGQDPHAPATSPGTSPAADHPDDAQGAGG